MCLILRAASQILRAARKCNCSGAVLVLEPIRQAVAVGIHDRLVALGKDLQEDLHLLQKPGQESYTEAVYQLSVPDKKQPGGV